jgi:MFS family permease
MLIAADIGQAVGTALLLLSFLSSAFQLWHLYLVSLLAGALDMLQRPAMEASVTILVPDSHRDRANVIRQIIGPAAGMIAPVITGFIYAFVG